MFRNVTIAGVFALVVMLPFLFRQPDELAGWSRGDPVLVVISPHNEAIRYEFGQAFSAWHLEHFGEPVKVDWRVIGGTTEIMRYLASEYIAAFRAWWTATGRPWPADGCDMIMDRRFDPDAPLPTPAAGAAARHRLKCDMHAAMRTVDDPAAFSCGVDVLFGGGAYDHNKAAAQGMTVPPWPEGRVPPSLVRTSSGVTLLPRGMSGETWRTDTFFGAALSTFGICYNVDRLADLGMRHAPCRWEDLAAPAYAGQLGVADPTKSGSISKAFEMLIHEQCHREVSAAGFRPEQVESFEATFREARPPAGSVPDGVPPAYQAAVEQGWVQGLRLVQKLGANARYFTDGAGRVPIDVAMGNAAAGLAIDFYGRYQAEMSRGPDGAARMAYITPAGGSSVSADPISLLRGAEHRELAVRFITFVLGEAGQRLWNYAPGTPGGPRKFALRRLPVRRDFYPSDDPGVQAVFEEHRPHTVDALGDPAVNPYRLAEQFTYYPRWTARHFNVQRDIIRAMCLDAGEELRAAWRVILAAGGPEANPDAMAMLGRLPDRPEPLTWQSALSAGKRYSRMELMREWTLCWRENYDEAVRLVRQGADAADTEVR